VGQVNKVGEDHIGLLILGIFNASITLEEMGQVNFNKMFLKQKKSTSATTSCFVVFFLVKRCFWVIKRLVATQGQHRTKNQSGH